MKAAGYIRVSTDEQSQQGVSIFNQAQRIQAYCTAKDWSLVAIFQDEGYSGKDLNRPAIKELIKECVRRKFDVVVTLKLDRLTRSVKDLGYIVEDVFSKNNIAFSSLQDNFDTSTANGRMMMNILATLAQWERDIISERTKDEMQYMKESLKITGALPFGFDRCGSELIPNCIEIEIIRSILTMRGQGASFQKISTALNSRNIASKNGGKWHPKTVRGVINHFRSLPGDPLVMKRVQTISIWLNICVSLLRFFTRGSPCKLS